MAPTPAPVVGKDRKLYLNTATPATPVENAQKVRSCGGRVVVSTQVWRREAMSGAFGGASAQQPVRIGPAA